MGRGLSALRHNSKSISFTYYQLKGKFDTYNGAGTIFGAISQKDLKGTKIINPSKSLIEAFVQNVGALDQKIELLSKEKLTLTNIRKIFLPKLLSGELKNLTSGLFSE